MPKDDDLLFALGALVLGLGLYHLITRPTARAYAVTAPCAAACAPFKNSPGTYATCCKQHAATAKPAVKPKTATKVYPSLASKPQSTNNLIEKVSLIDPWYSKPANITNYNIYPNQTVPRNPYTTSIRGGAPSGGGNVWPGIRCQTGCNQACGTGGCKSNESMRIQYGVKNSTPTVDFNARITIPPDYTAKDTATLQIGGGQHSKGCGWDGYKLYIGINGKPNAMGIEHGDGPNYAEFKDAKIYQPGYTLKPNQTYDLRATKQIEGTNVRVKMYANRTLIGEVLDTGQLGFGTPFLKRMGCPDVPIDQVRIDGWTEPEGGYSKYVGGVSSGPFNG